MLRPLLPQRLSQVATRVPQITATRSLFSTFQQVYPVTRQLPSHSITPSALFADTQRQYELQKTLFEISQMRIIPPTLAEKLQQPVSIREAPVEFETEWMADSVLRKRRLKMKKHKLRKRRKAQRALRRKLKKD